MARPREFSEERVLDAVVLCFWSRGYEATSMRELMERTGLTGASLYNAFGDKRALYERALDHYVEASIGDRIERCEEMPPLEGIAAFFEEIIARSLADPDHKGCLLVNAALDVAPHDAGFQKTVAAVLARMEAFFLDRVRRGQADRSIATALAAEDLARHLLAVLMGLRVLARVRPERALLEGALAPVLAQLRPRSA